MNFDKLNIEELVELRTKMIFEKKSVSQINRIIDKKEKEYSNYLISEDGECGSSGVAMANAGGSGMGAVVAAQPSSYAGTTIGSNWSGNGGTVGSGDVSNPLLSTPSKMYQKAEMGRSHGAMTGKKSRNKKLNLKSLKDIFAKKQDFTASTSPKSKKVMSFDNFQKDTFNKVTKVKENLYGINQRSFFPDRNVIVGNCYNCEATITEDDVYSGNFMCPSCETEGNIYELDNFNENKNIK